MFTLLAAGWPSYDYAVLQNKIQAGLGGPQEKPDLIIIRLGENIVNSQVELPDFKTAVKTLITKVTEMSAPGAKGIVTNSNGGINQPPMQDFVRWQQ